MKLFEKKSRINVKIKIVNYMEQLKLLLDRLKDIEIKSNPTPFNMLNIAYQVVTRKENLHSKLLAGLLNPKENHGLGSLCLEIFFKQIDVNFDVKNIDSVCITPERYINNGHRRFIDIFIEWKDDDDKKYAIIIENKLHDALDQENRLNDYFEGIYKEDYIVEKVIYIPYNKSYKSYKNTDSTAEVRNKCVDFDAEDIVKWLDETISNAQKGKESILIQYKEFFECLINKNFIYMKVAQDILAQDFSIKEISNLENLANVFRSKEWVQAFFNPITMNLQKRFGENLKVGYRSMKDVVEWDSCVYYVQYWVEPYKYWLEIGKHEDTQIGVYLCSQSSYGIKITFENETYETNEEEANSYYGTWYYGNVNKDKQFFNYAPKDEKEMQKLLDVISPILEELSKYKEE